MNRGQEFVRYQAAEPTVYDRGIYPYAQAWFKASTGHPLRRIPGYLDLLSRYGVSWEESRTTDPGVVLYEDGVQVVVTPYPDGPDQGQGRLASSQKSGRTA